MKARILMVACFAMEKPDAELIHFSSIANGLSRQGHDVRIFHLSLANAPAIRSLLLPEISFVERFVTAQPGYDMFVKGALSVPLFLGYILRHKPAVLYLRLGIVSALYAIAIRMIFGNRIKIITEHNGWIGPEALASGKPKILALIGQTLQRWSARCSHKVRAVSQGIKAYLVSLGIREDNIIVLGNGTNTEHFRPQDTITRYDIGFTGNLARWQGLEWLVDAFAVLVQRIPEASLAIAGAGPEEKDLQERIKKHNIQSRVSLLGPIAYQRIPDIINQCRICVAPKIQFTDTRNPHVTYSYSPLKIRDYAACGKPIIASRIAGLEEIEAAHFGLLIAPGDVQGLADAMARLLMNPALQRTMGRNARVYAEAHYAWGAITEQLSHHVEALRP